MEISNSDKKLKMKYFDQNAEQFIKFAVICISNSAVPFC